MDSIILVVLFGGVFILFSTILVNILGLKKLIRTQVIVAFGEDYPCWHKTPAFSLDIMRWEKHLKKGLGRDDLNSEEWRRDMEDLIAESKAQIISCDCDKALSIQTH